jgi:hypothetical protein
MGRIEDQDPSLGWRLSVGASCSVLGLVAESEGRRLSQERRPSVMSGG